MLFLGILFNETLGLGTTIQHNIGFRVGEITESHAAAVMAFEVNDLGNTHIVEEAANALHTPPSLEAVIKEIIAQFGRNAKAVWLCPKRKDAEHYYGDQGEGVNYSRHDSGARASKILLPDNAKIISDLGAQGKLWVYSGELAWQ